jgi:hypothetical protein
VSRVAREPGLSIELHPRVETALRAQLDRRAAALAAGASHVGWKIGASIAEVDALTGDTPVIGYLTTATLIPDGGAFAVGDATGLHAEVELVLGGGGFAVGLELVDTTRPPSSLEDIVAGNVFHRAAVLGAATACAPLGEARLWIDGELCARAPVSTNVDATRAHVAALLERLGLALSPHDRVLAGSLIHVPVTAGRALCAEIDGLGRVGVTLA